MSSLVAAVQQGTRGWLNHHYLLLQEGTEKRVQIYDVKFHERIQLYRNKERPT